MASKLQWVDIIAPVGPVSSYCGLYLWDLRPGHPRDRFLGYQGRDGWTTVVTQENAHRAGGRIKFRIDPTHRDKFQFREW